MVVMGKTGYISRQTEQQSNKILVAVKYSRCNDCSALCSANGTFDQPVES